MGLFGTPGRFEGFFGTPLTPFDDDLRIDREIFSRHVDFMVRSGIHALCVPMHLGESLNLSMDERKDLAELTVEAAAGRVPVTIHASCPGTDHTIELARHAEQVGADGVVVVSPYHWRPPEEWRWAHYTAVGDAIGIDLIAYNYPDALQVELSPEFCVRLIERLPNFLGMKDAKYDMQTFTEMCRQTAEARGDFSVFTGVEYLLPNMVVGGAGSFSACGAVAPRLMKSLYDAVSGGDYDRARVLQHRISRLWFMIQPGYPATIKAAMEIMGRPLGGTRLPIVSLDAERKAVLKERLRELAVLDEEPYGWDAAAAADPERALSV